MRDDFLFTSAFLSFAHELDKDIASDNTFDWYLKLPIRVCLAMLLAIGVILTAFIDSMFKVINSFNIKRENVMAVMEFLNSVPQGIKKVVTAICWASVLILTLSIAASSVGLILFGLKCMVGISVLLYTVAVVKENQANIWSAIESVQEKASNLITSCRDWISDCLNIFTFRSEQSAAAPKDSLAMDLEENTSFPITSTEASLYDRLPANPFVGWFPRDNSAYEILGDGETVVPTTSPTFRPTE